MMADIPFRTVKKINIAGFLKYYIFLRFHLGNYRKFCKFISKNTIAFDRQIVYH